MSEACVTEHEKSIHENDFELEKIETFEQEKSIHENDFESEMLTDDENKNENAIVEQEKLDQENNFEFDLKNIDFKDPNIDDDQNDEIEKKGNEIKSRPRLIRNQTRTKLINSKIDKKNTQSPISKKRLRPVIFKRTISNVNERLYNANLRRQPTYKTLAELVQEFDKKTRVYEDENEKKLNQHNLKFKNLMPKSPKLLSKNRNRTRTALSQLEQDELIALTIKKNTFKAQPINKKIFDNCCTGILKPQTAKKSTTTKTNSIGLMTSKRLEMRKEKMKSIKQSIENVRPTLNNVFKARPMPHFKQVPIVLRNYHINNTISTIKKQTSDKCLSNRNNEKMSKTILKQNSDSTLTRIVNTEQNHFDLDDELKENNDLISKPISENLSTFNVNEEESSICEYKSLTNFENSKEYEDDLVDIQLDN